jgi:hypothetical protein
MAGYSGTPLAKKLGIKEQHKVHAVGAPENYRALLEPPPPSVEFAAKLDRSTDVVHVFTTERAALAKTLAAFRKSLKHATLPAEARRRALAESRGA